MKMIIEKFVCYAVEKGNGEVFSDFFNFDDSDSAGLGYPFNEFVIQFVTVADPGIRKDILEFITSESKETKAFKGTSGRVYHFRIKECKKS